MAKARLIINSEEIMINLRGIINLKFAVHFNHSYYEVHGIMTEIDFLFHD